MQLRSVQSRQSTGHAIWLCLSMSVAAWCQLAASETPDPRALIERMKRSLSLPQNASMEVRVETSSVWHNAPSAEKAPYSGDSVEEWLLKSDTKRFGKEYSRESPSGPSRARTVFREEDWRVFEFDVTATPASRILGQLQVRNQYFIENPGQVPLADYLDPVFMFPSRFFDNGNLLVCAPEMVNIDGNPCYELGGTWNGRKFTFWLDPEYGCLPRQYTMELIYSRQENRGQRGSSGQPFLKIVAPPELDAIVKKPEESVERLSGVVLKRLDGRSYIAQAMLKKERSFEGDITFTQGVTFETTDFKQSAAPDVEAFLSFDGLLRDGTPIKELTGTGRFSQVTTRDFVWMDGRMVTPKMTVGAYMRRTWKDLRLLATDFSLENLKRLDSKLLIATCAFAALLVNGGMAYTSYRRKKSKSP